MNRLKRLFKRKISGEELSELLLNLGKDKKLVERYIKELEKSIMKGYSKIPFAYLDVKKKPGYGVEFDLEIYGKKVYSEPFENFGVSFSRGVPYRDLIKNPVLKKYVKKRNLESSLAVLSIASILASTIFLAGNITGNAILANNANSSGIIGAGLFVLGVASFILARNI